MTSKLPIDPRSPKEFWEKQHKLGTTLPIAWMLTAESLLRAFHLLADQVSMDYKELFVDDVQEESKPPISNVVMMIGALVIENLLKAIAVERVSQAFDERGNFQFKTHDLLKLAEKINLSLNDEEKRLLERLEQFLSWAGRYPAPLKSEDMRPRTLPNGGFASRSHIQFPTDFEATLNFVNKLKKELPPFGNLIEPRRLGCVPSAVF